MSRQESYPVEVAGKVIQVPAEYMHARINEDTLHAIGEYWRQSNRQRFHKKNK